MVGNKTTKRVKKPIETTLGKAPISPKGGTDVSHLRKPIDTSVTGLKQIVSLLENGTDEVKDILTYECDILYECRTCRSLFRSIANFILHKRSYCKERFYVANFINDNVDDSCVMPFTDHQPQENEKISRLSKVVEKLHKIGKVHEATEPIFAMDLSEEDPVKSMDQLEEKFSDFNQLVLEKIDSNDSGVFQTLNLDANVNSSNKLDVMELHRKLNYDVPVLDSEGKLFGFTSSNMHPSGIFPSSVFNCTKCSNKYSSQKTLFHHIRTIHNPTRLVFLSSTCNDPFANPWCVYRHLLAEIQNMFETIHNPTRLVFLCSTCNDPFANPWCVYRHLLAEIQNMFETIHNPTRLVFLCPTCNDPFANPWCVYRHLLRVHRMTNKQVKRMREQVNNSMMSRGEFDAKMKMKKPHQENCDNTAAGDCENQWITDIEGDTDFQICAGCGKHFERKAALHSHSQMCAKRLEMCNSIKEKAKKRALEEEALVKARSEISNERVALKGASKRKAGAVICVSKQISDNNSSILRATLQEDMKCSSRAITQSKSEETISIRPRRALVRRSHSSIERARSSDDVICLSSDESKDNSTSDLFSNEVSFEKFVSMSKQSNDDDVIFVDETDEGFLGFSPKVNLAELSYNNPLKKLKTKTTLSAKAAPYMDQTELSCIPCKTPFATMDLLMSHMSAHFSWFRFQCSKCSFVTYAESDCLSHVFEDHKLPENTCVVLPLPNWKSVLMSHDFRPLDPEEDFRGRHTDEKISFDVEDLQEELATEYSINESDTMLFGDGYVAEESSVKAEQYIESDEIDIMEVDGGGDLQVLPEPVELDMPALVSDSLKTSEENVNIGSEPMMPELVEEESNDDWGIPQPKQGAARKVLTPKKDEAVLPVLVTNSRPARIRTTVKQDDFLYYNRANEVGIFKSVQKSKK